MWWNKDLWEKKAPIWFYNVQLEGNFEKVQEFLYGMYFQTLQGKYVHF